MLTEEQQQLKIRIMRNHFDYGTIPSIGKVPAIGKDIWGFVEDVGNLLSVVQNFEGKAKPLLYTREYGRKTEYIDEEIISYNIIKRMPGTFGQSDPNGGNNVRMRKPRLLGIERDPLTPLYVNYVFEQWFDNFVELICWSLNGNAIDKRVEWLEDLMTTYAWFFEEKGFHFRYEGLGEQVSAPNKTTFTYYGAPLVYWVRTQKIYKISEKTIDTLIVNLQVKE